MVMRKICDLNKFDVIDFMDDTDEVETGGVLAGRDSDIVALLIN